MPSAALTILALLVIVLAAAAAVAAGAWRWRNGTGQLREGLLAARAPIRPVPYSREETDTLPAPVRRYLRAVLTDGQPMVATARMFHQGWFNMSETGEKWCRFRSDQLTVTRRPGFDWNGRIAMGLPVRVHDAYVAGEGRLHATLLGLMTVADLRGTPELAQGELMRFLAEAPWYPTTLLPGQGVRWEAIGDAAARATLTDGDTTATLDFAFDAEGLVTTVRSPARPRTVGGETVPTPWRGRFWDYRAREGMRVPTQGEAAWELPDGPLPYWRGKLTDIAFGFAR